MNNKQFIIEKMVQDRICDLNIEINRAKAAVSFSETGLKVNKEKLEALLNEKKRILSDAEFYGIEINADEILKIPEFFQE